MNEKKRLILAVACAIPILLILPVIAGAEDLNYVTVSCGHNWASDVDRTAGTRTANVEFESTLEWGAAIGRRVQPWLRVEGEFRYLDMGVKEITGHFGQDMDESGQDRFYTLMVNGLADFRNSTAITPFAGLGLGMVNAHHDVSFTPLDDQSVVVSDHHDWVFGYQLLAGVNWELNPKWSIDLMYRYLGTESRDHVQDHAPIRDVNVDSANIHSLTLGLHYRF